MTTRPISQIGIAKMAALTMAVLMIAAVACTSSKPADQPAPADTGANTAPAADSTGGDGAGNQKQPTNDGSGANGGGSQAVSPGTSDPAIEEPTVDPAVEQATGGNHQNRPAAA